MTDGFQAEFALKNIIGRFIRSRRISVQVVKHLMVGGFGVMVNWLVFTALRQYVGLSTLASTLIVHAVILVFVFPAQKHFTFNAKSQTRQQIIRFLVNDATYITLDFTLAWLFVDFIGLLPIIGKACGLAILTPLSFLSQRLWVFAPAPPSVDSIVD